MARNSLKKHVLTWFFNEKDKKLKVKLKVKVLF